MCSAYLDRAVVHKQAIEGGEGLASAINLAEGDGGNATTDTTRTVRNLNPLDSSDR